MGNRFSPGCRCCSCKPEDDAKVCATVRANCSPSRPIFGATITVKDAGGSIVGTCTTTGHITSLTRTNAGSGYTNGTGYALGYTGGGGGSGFTGTFDVVGGQVTNLQIINEGTGYTANITLTFPGAGGSGATGTGTVTAKCCVSIPKGGMYTVVASLPGFSDQTATVDATCRGSNDVTNFVFNNIGQICLHATMCEEVGVNNPVSGAVLTVVSHGTTFTATTGADGNACLSAVPSGPFTVTITFPDGYTTSGGTTLLNCSTITYPINNVNTFCVKAFSSPGGWTAGTTVDYTLKDSLTGATLGSCSLTLNACPPPFLGQSNGCCCIVFAPSLPFASPVTVDWTSSTPDDFGNTSGSFGSNTADHCPKNIGCLAVLC